MSLDAWITLAVVLAMVVVLVLNRMPPFAAVIGAVVLLMFAGVISYEQAFQGFASSAAATVAAFYVVAFAIEKTGALRRPLGRVFDDGRRLRVSLARIAVPAGVASAFVNNTPIVAMLVEPMQAWTRRTGYPASKVLIPLSYATILGGATTLIGTSTNLVVSDLVRRTGDDAFGFFELAKVGLPVALAGIVVILLLAPLLLPNRGESALPPEEERREYLVTMRVEDGRQVDGESLAAARLDHMPVVAVARGDETLTDVDSSFVLEGGDEITVRAVTDEAVRLQQKPGLAHLRSDAVRSVSGTTASYYEVVVGRTSPLVGSAIGAMERRYDAAVIGMRRSGEDAPVGADVRLTAGDALLVVAERGFREQWRNRTDFALVARIGGPPPTATKQAPFALLVLAGIVLLAAFGVVPVVEAAIGGVLVLILIRIVTPNEALAAVDWGVVFLIAAAFGLGAAVNESGLADAIADGFVDTLGGLADVVVVAGLLLLTMVLTELISNTAAAILAFPIAIGAAAELGIDPRIMAIAVAVVASCSFLTPVGYQTNTMVYGPGGYKFTDFARLGAPMAVTVLTVATAMVLILGT